MNWDKITGNEIIVEKLRESVVEKRISHAQLFTGKTGWGLMNMALAYAAEIFTSDKNEQSAKRVFELQHPDIHFTFPVFSDEDRKNPTSNMFFKEWRQFILEHPYGNSFDWLEFMEVPKKSGIINVYEAQDINRFLALNSYEGGHRFVIIWLPEMMNAVAANKLLKSIEEPPAKTIFLLLTEREDLLLPTILSRCQTVRMNRLTDIEMAEYLMKNQTGLNQKQIRQTVAGSNGDLREAMLIINSADEEFENRFVDWVRNAFMAKKNISVLKSLIKWSDDLSTWPREKQKQFLIYCSEIFRQALFQNYQVNELVYTNIEAGGFKWDGFSKFIHGANIEAMLSELNEAAYHIDRNANSKIVFLDLSIKLTRHIHKQKV